MRRAMWKTGWRLTALHALLLLAAASTQGQQFARLAAPADDRSASARAAGTAIVVDTDLVRSGPPRLELQATDGRILVAERSVFEDRGDGNAMWVGRFPGANYDSVVLTVQDGYLQGMFGEPDRAVQWIRAGPDGLGRLDQPVGRGPADGAEFCPGGRVDDSPAPSAAVAAARADRPTAVTGESNHDRIDILALYTVDAAEAWESYGYGTPRASIQASMDFLNLVLRNNSMPVGAQSRPRGRGAGGARRCAIPARPDARPPRSGRVASEVRGRPRPSVHGRAAAGARLLRHRLSADPSGRAGRLGQRLRRDRGDLQLPGPGGPPSLLRPGVRPRGWPQPGRQPRSGQHRDQPGRRGEAVGVRALRHRRLPDGRDDHELPELRAAPVGAVLLLDPHPAERVDDRQGGRAGERAGPPRHGAPGRPLQRPHAGSVRVRRVAGLGARGAGEA